MKRKKTSKKCSRCRYCLHENDRFEYVCHNEKSENYGQILKLKHIDERSCKDFEGHHYDMSLKDALRIATVPDGLFTVFYDERLPDKDNQFAYKTHVFKTNNDLEEYRDAITRLFTEYMDMAKKDGDFDN